MEIGLGISVVGDTKTAAERAVKRALAGNLSPEIAILFSSAKYNQDELLKTVSEAIPGVKIFGGSTAGEISNAGFMGESIMIILLSSNEIQFFPYFSLLGENPFEAGKDVGQQILQANPGLENEPGPISGLIMTDEKHFQGINYLKGIRKSLGFNLPISGGGSLNDRKPIGTDSFFSGYQYVNGNASQKALELLLIKGRSSEAAKFSYAFESSWSPVARPVKCTKAEGSKVFEVDNMRFDDYYKKIFGKDIFDGNTNLIKYSFITIKETPEGPKYLVRTPEKINHEDGSCNFFPAVEMQGATIQLVLISRCELIKGVAAAARKALDALQGFKPSMVFLFSCHFRKICLQSLVELEIEEVKKVFGDSVPIVGFYAGGEYGPLFSDYESIRSTDIEFGSSCQFSVSISIFAIGEKELSSKIVNYTSLLKNQIIEDKQDLSLPHNMEKERKRLEEELKEAEENVIITENSLKLLNRQHFNLVEEFEEKNRILTELISKNQKLQKILKQYTPRKVWEKSLKSAEMGFFRIPDEEDNYSILFLDVKGFTSFAENHTPKEVIRELNRIFEHAVNIIYENKGDVDKFIGDSIFALFETPKDAFRSAREIQEELKTLQAEDFPFTVRIGINHGRVIRGNVGGTSRRENTLIGDAVNLAQRLESNCTPGKILLSQSAYAEIGEELLPSDKIESRSITVKGKKDPLTVYEISV
ncbi:MAG: FIST C-terminal domain-containing protein [Candidatus Riflebacteria bacterium]|nr:FIST C-terminal domain-containing protein [Candidatus Riflebacteria bacterium]